MMIGFGAWMSLCEGVELLERPDCVYPKGFKLVSSFVFFVEFSISNFVVVICCSPKLSFSIST